MDLKVSIMDAILTYRWNSAVSDKILSYTSVLAYFLTFYLLDKLIDEDKPEDRNADISMYLFPDVSICDVRLMVRHRFQGKNQANRLHENVFCSADG